MYTFLFPREIGLEGHLLQGFHWANLSSKIKDNKKPFVYAMALSGRERDSKTAISHRRRQCTRHWPWTNNYFSHFPEILEISTL